MRKSEAVPEKFSNQLYKENEAVDQVNDCIKFLQHSWYEAFFIFDVNARYATFRIRRTAFNGLMGRTERYLDKRSAAA